jgi:hypothetical protein
MRLTAFNVFGQIYKFDQYLKVDKKCNGVTFINRGDSVVLVNGVPLAPSPLGPGFAGESIAFSGNEGEVYRGDIEIRFVAGGVDPQIVVLQKFYLD